MSTGVPSVLVVEDEAAQLEVLTYNLEAEGFTVTKTDNGDDALMLIDEMQPDIILLDWMLPGVSGIEICRRLKANSLTRNVPVIMLSARSEEVDKVRGLETGADDYMVKPFSPRELAARVRAVLRRIPSDAGGATADLASSPFMIDKPRARISYFGKPLDLSRYEYRLLEVLINRPGWVFSRERLMEMVWEEPEASLDRTVDTHIKTLRAKLARVKPRLKPIRTHRGQGYSLQETS